jgi:hypothetical protein
MKFPCHHEGGEDPQARDPYPRPPLGETQPNQPAAKGKQSGGAPEVPDAVSESSPLPEIVPDLEEEEQPSEQRGELIITRFLTMADFRRGFKWAVGEDVEVTAVGPSRPLLFLRA